MLKKISILLAIALLSPQMVCAAQVASKQIKNGAVTAAKMNSGAAASGYVATADGSGGVSFAAPTGGVGYGNVLTKTADYTMVSGDQAILCNATSGNIQITLLAASATPKVPLTVKKIAADSSSNTVTIVAPSSATIDGASSQVISTSGTAITVISDGSNYHIM